jgi:GNAT superfamily N-acetyltransferase
MEPYVSAYVNHGFKPVRRILRIDWDLNEMLPTMRTRDDINIKDASSYEPKKIASIFVKSLAPFWNWWIEEEGGPEEVARHTKEWLKQHRWFMAEMNREVLGLTGFSVGHEKIGKFIGVVVLPEHRMKRVGSTLMQNVLKEARKAGLKSLRVYTMAYLDRLAPGAVLYLKSGGRITAEYLQLEK